MNSITGSSRKSGRSGRTGSRFLSPTSGMTTAAIGLRSYGNENWEFDEHGLMRLRIASINDLPINESERRYHRPLGRRPDDHLSLSDLGF